MNSAASGSGGKDATLSAMRLLPPGDHLMPARSPPSCPNSSRRPPSGPHRRASKPPRLADEPDPIFGATRTQGTATLTTRESSANQVGIKERHQNNCPITAQRSRGRRANNTTSASRGVSRRGDGGRTSRGLPHDCPVAREGPGACHTRVCPSPLRSRPWRDHR